MISETLKKIEARECRIGIVGLGYVGLPLAIEFTNAGFNVLGLDIDEGKIEKLNKGETYIKHIPSSVLCTIKDSGGLCCRP